MSEFVRWAWNTPGQRVPFVLNVVAVVLGLIAVGLTFA